MDRACGRIFLALHCAFQRQGVALFTDCRVGQRLGSIVFRYGFSRGCLEIICLNSTIQVSFVAQNIDIVCQQGFATETDLIACFCGIGVRRAVKLFCCRNGDISPGAVDALACACDGDTSSHDIDVLRGGDVGIGDGDVVLLIALCCACATRPIAARIQSACQQFHTAGCCFECYRIAFIANHDIFLALDNDILARSQVA